MGTQRTPLVYCCLLDPRPATDAARLPIEDAVNIPLAELPERVYELPGRDEAISVVGPSPWAEQAVAWLVQNGRRAALRRDFEYAEAAGPVRLGRLWGPNRFLAEVLPVLAPGRALDLACGTGRDAVFAAACGWKVTAIDVLPDALERARSLAERYALALEPIEWRQADLARDPPAFETPFDLVFAFRFLHRPLLARMRAWVRSGGSVICETFTTLHRARHGKPARDDQVLRPGEWPGLLPGFEIRHHSEEWHGADHTARVWALRI